MRLDAYLYKIGAYSSRNKASEGIRRGEVSLNGKVALKSSIEVGDNDDISISKNEDFVSNGGYKLEKALSDFDLNVENLTFADIGASTGGFTDCLLRRGARFVYAIDVGESLLSKDLKADERVKVIDNFNARYLDEHTLGEKTDGVVCDVSFISLTYILKPIYDILKDGAVAITLIKPQFECGKSALNKNGIVTDPNKRVDAVRKIYDFGKNLGLTPINFTNAPIKSDKNREYLILWKKSGGDSIDFKYIEKIIKEI